MLPSCVSCQIQRSSQEQADRRFQPASGSRGTTSAPPPQFRYCSNAVIGDLVSFIATIFQPTALNRHDPAQRWRENVELWIARDEWKHYGQTQYALTVRNHTGAMKRARKVPAPNRAGFQRIHDDEAEPVFTQAQHTDFSLTRDDELPFRTSQRKVDYEYDDYPEQRRFSSPSAHRFRSLQPRYHRTTVETIESF